MDNIIISSTPAAGAGSAPVRPAPQVEVRVAEPPKRETPAPRVVTQDAPRQANVDLERRLDLLKRLANLYAVSDTRFTIYKQNGEYYTRITNLRDGKVTTVPEPDLLTKLSAGSIFETSV